MSDPNSIVQLLQAAGVLGGLVIFILALVARKLVLGWMYDAKAKECDEWKAMALEAKNLALKGGAVAESALDTDERLEAIETTLKALLTKRGEL